MGWCVMEWNDFQSSMTLLSAIEKLKERTELKLYYEYWLVLYLPLWKIWVRQLGLLFPIYGKIKNVPNHQPEYVRFDSPAIWMNRI